MTMLAALAVTGCLAVNSGADQILAGDFAAAIPGLSVPDPTTSVALAPAPGVERVFHAAELARLAAHFGWSGAPEGDVCFERPVAPPDPAPLLAAMRKAMPEAEITLLDYGRQPLPAGEIEFQASGLRPGSNDELWIGYVHYAKTRRFGLWARVKVLVPVTRLVAAEDLEPGRAITAEQVRAETKPDFPPALPVLADATAVIGKWPRAAIRAGAPIRSTMLENAKEVVRGDRVTVDVYDGAAHLSMEAVADGSGAIGETIPVLNPDSHKRFPAKVEGKGKVSVGDPPLER